MVFGTTYCAVSHLPINDGDSCILIPLGFKMDYEFNQWNTADINCFMNLYHFISAPQKIVYNGNPDMITYLDKKYEMSEKHELYMLVHEQFFNKVIEQYNIHFNRIHSLPLFKSVSKLWQIANDNNDEKAKYIMIDFKDQKITKEEYLHQVTNIPIPEWIVNLYKFAMFIDKLGIIPYPNHCVDQHDSNLLYEKIRSECQE